MEANMFKEAHSIQDAIRSAHELAGLLFALRTVFDQEDMKGEREAACDVLISKSLELAAELPHMIDGAHHSVLFAERASKATDMAA